MQSPRLSPPRQRPSASPNASRPLFYWRPRRLGFKRELSHLLLRVPSPSRSKHLRHHIPRPANRDPIHRQPSLQSLLPLRRPGFHDRSAQSHHRRHEHHDHTLRIPATDNGLCQRNRHIHPHILDTLPGLGGYNGHPAPRDIDRLPLSSIL